MKLLTHCPACNTELIAKTLACPCCELEMVNQFELSPFDYLSKEDFDFLCTFLKARGNLKIVQEELNISYPTAKKQLEKVLIELNLENEAQEDYLMTNKFEIVDSDKASEMIRNKLIQANGRTIVRSYDGTAHEITITADGKSFGSKSLNNTTYEFWVFDCIVELLKREGGKAKKGQARGKNDKVGSEKCNEHTVTGVIALEYYKKSIGDSVFDPVFLLAGMLEWAGIARNGRGYLELINA